ncbi:MAG TPA: MerR family transcriptional regulator [Bacteroidales bacterium]|nr:MerR family transcriptional regulator [Bacteroidales bacterium]HOL97326.1 MerR family transcriptional regulator [Bacteroidales bacterium]HOM36951.1 MerR family transcriptional regulator [Bacteroidales bacterium]HUM31661.1 MerR family transcriptional regulator [Bacteroidales bacterium]
MLTKLEYNIKDLECISGIKAHTIRIWEKRYNIFEPQRTATNIRKYTDSELRKLLAIVYLLKCGYKIGKLSKLSNNELFDLFKECEIYNQKEESYLMAMLSFDEEYFGNMFTKSISQIGFDETFTKLIYPLLDKIGMLWIQGSILPVHEHFVTNIIRKKIISEIEKQKPVPQKNCKVLFALPETEGHEASILYSYYLARKSGLKTLYLGQFVPRKDLYEIIRNFNPDFFVTFFVTKIEDSVLNEIISDYEQIFSKTKLIISGNQVIERKLEINPNKTKIVNSPEEIKSIFEKCAQNSATILSSPN